MVRVGERHNFFVKSLAQKLNELRGHGLSGYVLYKEFRNHALDVYKNILRPTNFDALEARHIFEWFLRRGGLSAYHSLAKTKIGPKKLDRPIISPLTKYLKSMGAGFVVDLYGGFDCVYSGYNTAFKYEHFDKLFLYTRWLRKRRVRVINYDGKYSVFGLQRALSVNPESVVIFESEKTAVLWTAHMYKKYNTFGVALGGDKYHAAKNICKFLSFMPVKRVFISPDTDRYELAKKLLCTEKLLPPADEIEQGAKDYGDFRNFESYERAFEKAQATI